jgi:cytochrome c553
LLFSRSCPIDQNAYQELANGPEPKTARAEQKPGLSALAEPPPEVGLHCARCHGTDGRGREHAFPNIAGLNGAYILDQLDAFGDATRPSGFMQPVAANLTDEEKKKLAAYFARLARGEVEEPVGPAADLKLGESIAQFGISGKVPGCLSCHSANPADLGPDIPQLTGQSSEYLVQQLLLFRSGARAQTRNDEIMARFAKELTETEIKAVSAYFASRYSEGELESRTAPVSHN